MLKGLLLCACIVFSASVSADTLSIPQELLAFLQEDAVKNSRLVISDKASTIEKLILSDISGGVSLYAEVVIQGKTYKAYNEHDVKALREIVKLSRYMGDLVTGGLIKNSYRKQVLDNLLDMYTKS